MNNLIEYLLLGLIQGLTEPLPISSSGHLLIFKKIFGITLNDLNLEIIVNFGSFLAILFLYRKIIFKIIKDFFLFITTKNIKYKTNFNYAFIIILASIPAGVIGLIFKDKIELISGNIKYIGFALLITAFSLFIVRKIDGKKSDKEINHRDALKIGLFQAIALLPGISRSGSTIVGGLLCNLKKETAVNFSFLLYIPISIATIILGIIDLINTPNIKNYIIPYTLSMLISMIVTYFSSKIFINIIKEKKLIYFVIYCLVIGLLVLLFL